MQVLLHHTPEDNRIQVPWIALPLSCLPILWYLLFVLLPSTQVNFHIFINLFHIRIQVELLQTCNKWIRKIKWDLIKYQLINLVHSRNLCILFYNVFMLQYLHAWRQIHHYWSLLYRLSFITSLLPCCQRPLVGQTTFFLNFKCHFLVA